MAERKTSASTRKRRQQGKRSAKPGAKGTATEKVQRDQEIFRAHLRGIDAVDISLIYDVSVQTVRDVVREQRIEYRKLSTANPMEVIEELLMQVDAAISELATQTTKLKGAARITAINSRIRAIFAKADFMQQVGVLPKTPDTMRIQFEAAGFVERLLDLLDQRGLLNDELVGEIEATFSESGGIPIDLDATEVDEDTEAIALEAG